MTLILRLNLHSFLIFLIYFRKTYLSNNRAAGRLLQNPPCDSQFLMETYVYKRQRRCKCTPQGTSFHQNITSCVISGAITTKTITWKPNNVIMPETITWKPGLRVTLYFENERSNWTKRQYKGPFTFFFIRERGWGGGGKIKKK